MNTPKIRFKGFADEWEQRKLGDLFEIIDTKHATAPTSNVKTQFRMIRTNCVRNGRLISENTDSVTEEIYEKWSERIHLREGDLVFTREAPMGESAVITNDGNKYFPGQRVVSMRSLGNVKACFINQLFYSNEFRKEIQIREAASTTVANFGIPQIKNYLALIPCLDEQIKIGDLFSCIDKLITLYQRKCNSLNAVKKYMLQKMFPQNGAKVPEIRFKGFTGDWEQRKLGEILEVVTRKNGDQYTKEDVLSVSDEYGCVNQIAFQGRSFAGEDISNYKIVKTGDIIYTRSPLQAKPYGIVKIVGSESGIISPLYIVNVPKEGNCSKFIYYAFDTPQRTNNYLSPLVRKGAKNTMNISNDEWLSGNVIVAPSYEEQLQIGEYFEILDNLIALHQRKCDSLKELKKFMLQNMFP